MNHDPLAPEHEDHAHYLCEEIARVKALNIDDEELFYELDDIGARAEHYCAKHQFSDFARIEFMRQAGLGI